MINVHKGLLRFIVAEGLLLLVGAVLVATGLIGSFSYESGFQYTRCGIVLLGLVISVMTLVALYSVCLRPDKLRLTIRWQVFSESVYEIDVIKNVENAELLVFLEGPIQRFYGRAVAYSDRALLHPIADVVIKKTQPKRWRVPTWILSSDSGKTIDRWPKRIGASYGPIRARFSSPLTAGTPVFLQFKLSYAFQGFALERSFPATGYENLLVIIK